MKVDRLRVDLAISRSRIQCSNHCTPASHDELYHKLFLTQQCVFMFVFFCGDRGSRGCYDISQPELRRVCTAAKCTVPCVRSVFMYVWCVATVVMTVRVCL